MTMEDPMIRLFVRHPVADFARWKEGYDAFDADRSGLGVKAHGVYQSVENANDVTIWHDFESMDSAQAFMASPRLKEAMDGAGVAGEPVVWFTRTV